MGVGWDAPPKSATDLLVSNMIMGPVSIKYTYFVN